MTKTFHPNNNNNPDTRDPRKYVTRKKDPEKKPLRKIVPQKNCPHPCPKKLRKSGK